MAVPEADRDVHKGRSYHEKKLAIAGIPFVDEDGQVVECFDSENYKEPVVNDLEFAGE